MQNIEKMKRKSWKIGEYRSNEQLQKVLQTARLEIEKQGWTITHTF